MKSLLLASILLLTSVSVQAEALYGSSVGACQSIKPACTKEHIFDKEGAKNISIEDDINGGITYLVPEGDTVHAVAVQRVGQDPNWYVSVHGKQ